MQTAPVQEKKMFSWQLRQRCKFIMLGLDHVDACAKLKNAPAQTVRKSAQKFLKHFVI